MLIEQNEIRRLQNNTLIHETLKGIAIASHRRLEVFVAIKHNLTPFHGFYRRGTKKLDIFGTRLSGQ